VSWRRFIIVDTSSSSSSSGINGGGEDDKHAILKNSDAVAIKMKT
jgi:hypothetical protein